MIFDTRGHSASALDASLMPAGFGTAQKEPFATWQKRNNQALAHLHPAISEQWIYKHWTSSPYKNLPIEDLTWRQDKWKTDKILNDVFRRWPSGSLEPKYDYDTFHGKAFEPALTMDKTGRPQLGLQLGLDRFQLSKIRYDRLRPGVYAAIVRLRLSTRTGGSTMAIDTGAIEIAVALTAACRTAVAQAVDETSRRANCFVFGGEAPASTFTRRKPTMPGAFRHQQRNKCCARRSQDEGADC
jgi:hypothetical protein